MAPLKNNAFSVSVLGDGINVDQKDYYCIEIDLPDAPLGPTTELFMLDTAATSSLLTPKASKRLGGGKSKPLTRGSHATTLQLPHTTTAAPHVILAVLL